MDKELNDLRRRAGIKINEDLMQDTAAFFNRLTGLLRRLNSANDNPNMLRNLATRNLNDLRTMTDDIPNADLRAKFSRFVNNSNLLSKDHGRLAYTSAVLNLAIRFGSTIDPNSEFSSLFINRILDWAGETMGVRLPELAIRRLATTPEVVAGFRTFYRQFNNRLNQVIAANTP